MADDAVTFRREYLCRPAPRDVDAEERYLEWLGYRVKTEEYDRTLPGAFHDRWPDVWMVFPTHLHMSLRYARAERAKLSHAAMADREAKRFSLRGTHTQRKAILAQGWLGEIKAEREEG